MIKYYSRYIVGDSIIRSYYSCLSQLDRGLDYISFDMSNGVCPYKAVYPYCYKKDLEVNKVTENTKIRSWEI